MVEDRVARRRGVDEVGLRVAVVAEVEPARLDEIGEEGGGETEAALGHALETAVVDGQQQEELVCRPHDLDASEGTGRRTSVCRMTRSPP